VQNVIRSISINLIYITDAFIAILLDACSATMMWKHFVLLVTSKIIILRMQLVNVSFVLLLDASNATMMWSYFAWLVTSKIITLRMQLVNVSFVHWIIAKHAVHFYNALNAKLLFPLIKQQKRVTLIIRVKIVHPDSIWMPHSAHASKYVAMENYLK
jgi:hypothetical protein